MKPNVFVFFLDTIRVDQLRLGGQGNSARNFIEHKLTEGTFFSNFIVAGNSTRVSVNGVFNGFYGGATGLNFHWGCDEAFAESRVISLADVFKYEGYRTLAVSQGDVYLPRHGFDDFWIQQEAMDLDRIADHLAESADPSFSYLHFSELHDKAFGQPEQMTRENYRAGLDDLAAEVEAAWSRLVGPQDVVVLVSDHGCRLRETYDPDWRFHREEEPTGGIFLSEETIRGVCSIVGPGVFPATNVASLTRGIDVFPTLLDGLGIERPEAQGCSLWPALNGEEEMPELTAYMETGGHPQADGQAPSRGVRTEDWKFVRYETWGEELYDLRNDPDARSNLIGLGLPAEDTMRQVFEDCLAANARGMTFYQMPTAELCAAILAGRAPMVVPQRGRRPSCFKGMVTAEVRAHLKAQTCHHLPNWIQTGQRIVVYSASEHSQAFLECEELIASGVVIGVVDSNPDLRGGEFCSLPVFDLHELERLARPTMILVGHYFFANDMYLQLRENCREQVPVFNVYRLADEIPLWWDRVPDLVAVATEPKD